MWEILSKVLNVILGLFTLYLYLENRKLKGFEIEKNIELKFAEQEELDRWYREEKEKQDEDMAGRGLPSSGTRNKAQENLRKDFDIKTRKLVAEIEYLDKLKNYRGPFLSPAKSLLFWKKQ